MRNPGEFGFVRFDRSPVHQKLATMEIHLTINRRDRNEEKSYFLNDRVHHTLTEGLQPRRQIRFTIHGERNVLREE